MASAAGASAQEQARRRRNFTHARKSEARYGQQLRGLARQIGNIVNGFEAGDPAVLPLIEQALSRYAELIEPWARATVTRVLAEISHRDTEVWADLSRDMGRALRDEIRNAPTGEMLRQRLAEQVRLIKSLPIEAAERVHRLTLEGIENSTRADEIAAEIRRTSQVTQSRATLIARTEVARTASGLVQARSTFVGSPGYIWQTARDSDVRPSHRKMQGKFVRWDQPPTLDKMVGHAGEYPNCRCYPQPVLPDEPT
jgi:SPP1 gp7 family putative phage head morphogenesis protein